MYGKVFEQFFDSSINEEQLHVRFVFIGMLTLSDSAGRLDITRPALARRLNLPADKVDDALERLSAPDPFSRDTEGEGRRIIPLDPPRSWGWIVVNKSAYQDRRDFDLEREKTRARVQRHRGKKTRMATAALHVTAGNACNPTETETETDTDTENQYGQTGLATLAVQDNPADGWAEVWAKYPRKEKRSRAESRFRATVKTRADLLAIQRALDNYLVHVRGIEDPTKIQQGGTWFGSWQEWASGCPVHGQKCGAPARDLAVGAERPAEDAAEESAERRKAWESIAPVLAEWEEEHGPLGRLPRVATAGPAAEKWRQFQAVTGIPAREAAWLRDEFTAGGGA
jgi:hypothetical protein